MLKKVYLQFTIHRSRFTKAIAFTLAETLIVMGIIGVVAALTLPNLNSSTGEKEKIAKVKKIYSNLNDAVGRAQSVYGPINEWFANDNTNAKKSKRAGERITEFMKISKTCGSDTTAGCVTTGSTKNISGQVQMGAKELAKDTNYSYITADGSSLVFVSNSDEGTEIYVDIDGPNKGKFTNGVDVFSFSVYLSTDSEDDDGTLRPGNTVYTESVLNCINNGLCTTWVINHDNMDYLKVTSAGKCPDNQMLNDSHPTCK